MIDTRRHEEVFSAAAFGPRRVDVIGAGATGSRVVMDLAKLGIQNIHVWDFDNVESHNVANQVYGIDQIGQPKVTALHDLVKCQTGTSITPHNQAVDGTQELGAVVFLLTDTMASRKQIWERGLRYKMRTKLVIETRMGADQGRVYTVDPSKPAQIRGWESTLCDDVVAVSACGTSISVGPTAEYLASLAVWQLVRWFAIELGAEDKLNHEMLWFLRPPSLLTRNFD